MLAGVRAGLPVTEQAALSRLQEAYRNTGLEVRFYPECCTIMRFRLGRNDGDVPSASSTRFHSVNRSVHKLAECCGTPYRPLRLVFYCRRGLLQPGGVFLQIWNQHRARYFYALQYLPEREQRWEQLFRAIHWLAEV